MAITIGARVGTMARMTPRITHIHRWGHRAAWTSVVTANAGAALHLWPWLPAQLNTLAVGACLAVTVVTTWTRTQAPLRAAFLDGVLHEREHGAELPAAVGDGIAPVVKLSRGRHRPSPARR